MPRVIITTKCQATLTEEWTLDVTAAQLAELRQGGEDGSWAGRRMIDGAAPLVGQRDVGVDGEFDREMTTFEVVEPTYVPSAP